MAAPGDFECEQEKFLSGGPNRMKFSGDVNDHPTDHSCKFHRNPYNQSVAGANLPERPHVAAPGDFKASRSRLSD